MGDTRGHRPSRGAFPHLMRCRLVFLKKSAEKADRQREFVAHAVAGLDRPVDNESQPCDEGAHGQGKRHHETGAHHSHNSRKEKPQAPGDLKIQHAPACGIDARHLVFL